MAVNKLDRRKKYTRMMLKNSLIKLLSEKPISAITVKEICELADINRSTFYAHYENQFDLLDKVEDEIIGEMNEYLSQYGHEKERDTSKLIERLLEYYASKEKICKILLSENTCTSFEKKVMNSACRFMKETAAMKRFDSDISDYVTIFVISGSIHTLKKWLFSGMTPPPKEMAEIINKLIMKGLNGSASQLS